MKGLLLAGAVVVGLTTVGAKALNTSAPVEMCDKKPAAMASVESCPLSQNVAAKSMDCDKEGKGQAIMAAQPAEEAEKTSCCPSDKSSTIVAQIDEN